jgi:hypothetical protein
MSESPTPSGTPASPGGAAPSSPGGAPGAPGSPGSPAVPAGWSGLPSVPGHGPAPISPWFRPATIGARLTAWLIDMALFALLSVGPLAVAFATGGIAVNPVAARQLEADPNGVPTVPYLLMSAAPLAASAALWVVLAIAYAAICWAASGRLPGQAVRSMYVVDAQHGRRLSVPRSIWRAVLVAGVPTAAFAVSGFALCHVASLVPMDRLQDTERLRLADVDEWVSLFSWTWMAGTAWCVALLIGVVTSRDGRGIHDRLSGSVVLSRVVSPVGPASWWPAMPVPPYATPGATPRVGAAGEPNPAPQIWTGLAGDPGAFNPADAPDDAPPAGTPDGAPFPGARARDRKPAEAADIGRSGPIGAKLPEGLRIAAFRRRVGAYSLDAFLVLLLYLAVEWLVAPPSASGEIAPERLRMLSGFLGGVAQCVYFVGTWWILRGSIGQRFNGIKVVRESGERRIGPIDALVRWAVLQGPLALLMAAPDILSLALIMALFGWTIVLVRAVQQDPDGRGYHDRIAGSVVVERSDPLR